MEAREAARRTKEYMPYVARAFILLLIPFMLGALVLPHTQVVNGTLLGSPQESELGDQISYSFNHTGSDIAVASNVNAIFPLANYLDFQPFVSHGSPELCFQDNDSYLVLTDGSKFQPDFFWIVDFNNETELIVHPDGTNCTSVLTGQDNNYKWFASMAIPNNDSRFQGNITFVPVTLTYPRAMVNYGLLQGLVMIPVCYLFLWYPSAGIWKKLHKGLLEQ